MTIFTSRVTEKKDGENVVPSDVVSDYMFAKKTENLENDPSEVSGSEPTADVEAIQVRGFRGAAGAHRRHCTCKPMLNLCVFLLGMVFLMAAFIGGISLYKHLANLKSREHYQGMCGVRYHNMNGGRTASMMLDDDGEFEQEVEIERDYELIKVPSLGDTSMATILHDFNVNMTAIVDDEQKHCFLLPLNRTLILPPRDFWDLLEKLKSGYYMPDAEVLQKNYRANFPPIVDLSSYGAFIKNECANYDTYLLVPEDAPFALTKRSACIVAGRKYCLGDAGRDKMMCINIASCN